MSAEKIKLAKLLEYTTRDGRQYFRGYMDECVVLVFRDDYAKVPDGCNGIWSIFIEPKQQRKNGDRSNRRNASDMPAEKAPATTHTAPNKRRAASSNRPGYHPIDRKALKPETAADKPFIDDDISF